jgi:hypothetical protein
MEPTAKSNSINLGLYLGATLAAVIVLIYAINLDLMVKWWLSIVLILIIVTFGSISAKKAKAISGGFISFKDAFVNYFITIAIGTAISTVVGVLIFVFVDPEAAAYVNEQILVATKQSMERFGAPQELIDSTIEEASKKDNFSLANQLQSYVFQLAFYAVIGLIVALIVKKTDKSQA